MFLSDEREVRWAQFPASTQKTVCEALPRGTTKMHAVTAKATSRERARERERDRQPLVKRLEPENALFNSEGVLSATTVCDQDTFRCQRDLALLAKLSEVFEAGSEVL